MTDPSYNDTHRALLQSFLAHGTLTFETARPLLAHIQTAHERHLVSPSDITEEDFTTHITALSSAVAPFDYEIRSTTHQVTRQKVYGFLNAASDGITQAATGFSADEIAFVKRVLDAIFETFNTKRREVCAVTNTQALQLHRVRDAGGSTQNGEGGSGTQGYITMGNAEEVLAALVSQGWFEKSRKGYFSLSPRALMELRGWLMETYNDQEDSDDDGAVEDDSRFSGQPVKLCQACKEIVTVGQRCSDKNCAVRLHNMCTERFFRMQKSSKCPKCRKDWKDHHQVGEKAADVNSAGRRSTGQITAPPRRRNRVSQTNGGGDDDDDDDDDEEEE